MTEEADPRNVEESLRTSDVQVVRRSSEWPRIAAWLIFANAAILLNFVLVSMLFNHGAPVWNPVVYGLVIFCGGIIPFFLLLFSKALAVHAHQLTSIDPANPRNAFEADLYDIVADLASRAGLEHIPEVGYYDSDDINAFAVGATRRHSLMAFSTALLQGMNKEAIVAVAAHELAHVASRDTLLLTLLQATVNIIVLILMFPIRLGNLVLTFLTITYPLLRPFGPILRAIGASVKFVAYAFFVFLGSLLLKLFSRRREFMADAMSASLVGTDAMISALSQLKEQGAFRFPEQQASYAAFKVCSPPALFDLFSTHPSLDRRIARLRQQRSEEQAGEQK